MYMSCYFKSKKFIKLGEVGRMEEFTVELSIENAEGQNIKFSSLNEKEMIKWKLSLEQAALSEYYKQKIKISSKKI